MADDIGPGDVVEAVTTISVPLGTRAIVQALLRVEGQCYLCAPGQHAAMVLNIGLNKDGDHWCPNHWRKIGGSRADTVRRFAEDLGVSTPQKVDA